MFSSTIDITPRRTKPCLFRAIDRAHIFPLENRFDIRLASLPPSFLSFLSDQPTVISQSVGLPSFLAYFAQRLSISQSSEHLYYFRFSLSLPLSLSRLRRSSAQQLGFGRPPGHISSSRVGNRNCYKFSNRAKGNTTD